MLPCIVVAFDRLVLRFHAEDAEVCRAEAGQEGGGTPLTAAVDCSTWWLLGVTFWVPIMTKEVEHDYDE